MNVIDLTQTISEDMPVYPGTERPKLLPASSYEKDGFKETLITMFSHTGTHIDPPCHIYPNGKRLDEFEADSFVGKALVIDCRDKKNGETVTMDDLLKCDGVYDAEFLLFCFGWDKKWGSAEYFGEYPCLSDEVVDFISNGKYKGIGFDVIGLDPIADVQLKLHHKLFKNDNLINIENLRSLDACIGKNITLCCLPIKIENSDGAPARAVAIIE